MWIPHSSEYSGLLRACCERAYLVNLSLFTLVRLTLEGSEARCFLGFKSQVCHLKQVSESFRIFPLLCKRRGLNR